MVAEPETTLRVGLTAVKKIYIYIYPFVGKNTISDYIFLRVYFSSVELGFPP